jgi:hypothetical protein
LQGSHKKPSRHSGQAYTYFGIKSADMGSGYSTNSNWELGIF